MVGWWARLTLKMKSVNQDDKNTAALFKDGKGKIHLASGPDGYNAQGIPSRGIPAQLFRRVQPAPIYLGGAAAAGGVRKLMRTDGYRPVKRVYV